MKARHGTYFSLKQKKSVNAKINVKWSDVSIYIELKITKKVVSAELTLIRKFRIRFHIWNGNFIYEMRNFIYEMRNFIYKIKI